MRRRTTIDDPAVAACFARGRGSLFLAPYFDGPASVGEAAAYLHRPLAKTHYWTRRWCDFGVLEVVDEIARAGRPIKRYATTADEFVIPAHLLPDDLLTRQVEQAGKQLAESLVWAVPHIAFGGSLTVSKEPGQRNVSVNRAASEAESETAGRHALMSTFTLTLTDDEAARAKEELEAWSDRWARPADRPGPKTHMVMLGISPVKPD